MRTKPASGGLFFAQYRAKHGFVRSFVFMPVAHFLDTTGLTTASIAEILREAATFITGDRLSAPSTRPLQDRRIVLAFFEPSTRTRLSFETAAHRLGASTYMFQPESSSVEKGETLEDTLRTLHAMGMDGIVLRHAQDGILGTLAATSPLTIVNAGEGCLAHPSQALLDAATLTEQWGTLDAKRICIVGDIRHSRVARSNVDVLSKLGAQVAICAPETLMPDDAAFAGCQRIDTIDEALEWADAVTMLRIQRERITAASIPTLETYRARYALTVERAYRFPSLVVMHPGPVNIGVELDAEVLALPNTLIDRQVTHGVAVRMAILRRLFATL